MGRRFRLHRQRAAAQQSAADLPGVSRSSLLPKEVSVLPHVILLPSASSAMLPASGLLPIWL